LEKRIGGKGRSNYLDASKRLKVSIQGKNDWAILESEIYSPPKKCKNKYRSNFFQVHES